MIHVDVMASILAELPDSQLVFSHARRPPDQHCVYFVFSHNEHPGTTEVLVPYTTLQECAGEADCVSIVRYVCALART